MTSTVASPVAPPAPGPAPALSGLPRTSSARKVKSVLATGFMSLSVVVALIPLVAIIAFVVLKGAHKLGLGFLTHSMVGVGPFDTTGGEYHAIVGTVEQVFLAGVIAIPLGILVAIDLVEYDRGRVTRAIRFMVDVLTGLPSIVAGLFIYSFWVLSLHQGFSGLAAALSLAVLMLPIVARSSEEMLKLVPDQLREAALALGIPKWRTVVSVVLPTAGSGIITGVMLAVARVAGETAPLLLTLLTGSLAINFNPFHGLQSSLPLYVYNSSASAFINDKQRAYAAALTLVIMILFLNLAARLLVRRSKVGS
jgi:phosphate transport system permease protein